MGTSKLVIKAILIILTFTSLTMAGSTVHAASTVTLTLSYLGSPPQQPVFTYVLNGHSVSAQLTSSQQNFTVDAGSTWTVTKVFPGPGSQPVERWSVKNENGVATSDMVNVFEYYHQFRVDASYTATGRVSGLGPNLRTTQYGRSNDTRLATSPSMFWVDALTTWTVNDTLPGSNVLERWWNQNTTGTIASGILHFDYVHQYWLNANVDRQGAGSSSVASGWRMAGDVVQVQAIANSGFAPQGWSCNPSLACNTQTGPQVTVTMNSPVNVTARFQQVVPVNIMSESGVQTIIVDGQRVTIGSNPVSVQLPPGSHSLTAFSNSSCGFDFGPISIGGFSLGPFAGCQWEFVQWSINGKNTTDRTVKFDVIDKPVTVAALWKKSYVNLAIMVSGTVIILMLIIFVLLKKRRPPPHPPGPGPVAPPSGLRYRVGLLSDVGRVRSNNEDGVLAMEILSSFDSKPASSFLCAVADGVGGSQKGEVASKLALQTLAVRASEFLLGPARKEISRALGTSIEHANEVLVNYGMSHSESEGLATTIVASIIDGKTAYLAHAGDSRAYLINRAEVKQLTKDHSQVQEFVDAGKIKPEQARHYPGRNVITRAVGAATDIEVSTSSVPVSHGDQLLLCTDGLWEPVTDVEMQKIVLESDPQKACSKLVSLANERGGKDNATIVIVQIHDPVNMKPL